MRRVAAAEAEMRNPGERGRKGYDNALNVRKFGGRPGGASKLLRAMTGDPTNFTNGILGCQWNGELRLHWRNRAETCCRGVVG